MAATTTANFAGLLVEVFSRDRVFAPHERALAKFHSSTLDWEDEEPLGKGRTFGIRTKDAHATGTVSESAGTTPTTGQPEVLQANIDAVQYVGVCAWSELMMTAGRGLGSLGPDVVTDHVQMTTRNATQLLNRMSLGHGTGRLAALNATANSADQVLRNPESLLQLRVNMKIDLFDTDTSGSKQGSTVTINDLDLDTRTVTFSAAVNGTAGWGLYQAVTTSVSTYGVAPFGLRAWADDGELTSAIGGITRSTNPGVNANVITVSSGTQPYTEKLMRKAINRIFFACGMEPDEAWTNKGIISEHLNHLVGDRIFMLSPGDNVPKYRIGYNEMDIGFQNGGSFIPYKCDGDMPNREIIFITKNMFRRHQLRPLNWLGDDSGVEGSAREILMQLPSSSGGYDLSKIAILLGMGNYGNRMPKSICRVSAVADEELAGD